MAELVLFFSAFLAATILPFSSEAAVALSLQNNMPVLNVMLSASSGNILAIVLNYYLGYFLYEQTKTKLLSSKTGKKAFSFGHRYGYFALLFSWLPIVGDPITLVAGLIRMHFFWFVVIAGSLRVLRYYMVVILLG